MQEDGGERSGPGKSGDCPAWLCVSSAVGVCVFVCACVCVCLSASAAYCTSGRAWERETNTEVPRPRLPRTDAAHERAWANPHTVPAPS